MDRYTLMHHGVKGQKWGVRRYQNENGSYTDAGKKRRKEGQSQSSEKTLRSSTRKERHVMSDEELDNRIKRIEKEIRLKDLEMKNVDEGRIYCNNLLKSIGTKVITTVAAGGILYGVKAAISGKFDADELADAVVNGGPKKK